MKSLINFSIYAAGVIAVRGTSYVLMPILTRYLTLADFGIVYLFTSFILFFVPFVGLQSDTYITRNFFRLPKTVFSEHITDILKLMVISTIICLFVAVLIPNLPSILNVSSSIILLAILMSSATAIGSILLIIYQLQGEAWRYSLIIFISTIINFCISIILVVLFNLTWKGRLIGICIPIIIQCLFTIYILNKDNLICYHIRINHFKSIMIFSLPLMLGSISGWIIGFSDKLFISKLATISSVGLYGIGSSMGMVSVVFSDSIFRAWVPYFFKTIGENSDEKKNEIVKYSYIILGCLLLLSIIVYFLALIFIKYMLAKEYHDSQIFVAWIVIGQFFYSIYAIFLYYLIHENKTSIMSFILILSAIISVMSNYLLINHFGPIGAAFSYCISYFFMALLTMIYAQKYHSMPWLTFFKSNTRSIAG